MATPTVAEVLVDEDTAAAASVATAAGTAVGDLLLAIGISDFYALADFGPPTPGTWTQIQSVGPDDNTHMRAWYRFVTSGGANTVSLSPIDDEDVGLYVYRLTGADGTTPVDASGATNGTSASTSHTAPSVSPASSDALLICAWATGNGAYTATPGGMTARTNIDGSPFYEAIAADQVLSASGATGTRTATFDASRAWVAVSIAVQGEAASGITGTLAVTEAADTLAASGTVTPPPITGTLAVTEAADTLSAAGTVEPPEFTGTVAVAEQADTLAAAGAVTPPAVAGTLAVVEAADTLSAAGTVTDGSVAGTLAVTEQADTLAGAGAVTGNVDITVTVGPTRLRAAVTAAATRERQLADADATRLGWAAGATRVGWAVDETRVDRE